MKPDTILTDKSIEILISLKAGKHPAPLIADIVEAALTQFKADIEPRTRKPYPPVRKKKIDPRTDEFFNLYENGMSQPDISKKFNISRERVRQIISKHPSYKRHKNVRLTPQEKKELLHIQAVDKFWARVDKSGGPSSCWPWMGCINKKTGYGHFTSNKLGARAGAHRTAYILTFGEVPEGMMVLHKCNNPACCNPNPGHLYAGTPKQNMADREARYLTGEISLEWRNKLRVKKEVADKIVECYLQGLTAYRASVISGCGFATARNHYKRLEKSHPIPKVEV